MPSNANESLALRAVEKPMATINHPGQGLLNYQTQTNLKRVDRGLRPVGLE